MINKTHTHTHTINSAKEARAEKYREKGNEHFRQGKFPQALKKYTRSLDAKMAVRMGTELKPC